MKREAYYRTLAICAFVPLDLIAWMFVRWI